MKRKQPAAVVHLLGGPCAWEPQTPERSAVTCAVCKGHLRAMAAITHSKPRSGGEP